MNSEKFLGISLEIQCLHYNLINNMLRGMFRIQSYINHFLMLNQIKEQKRLFPLE